MNIVKLIPMLMLFAGVALAAAFGSRNGDSHIDSRTAMWAVGEAAAGVAREAELAKASGDAEAQAELREAHEARTAELRESGFLGTIPVDAQVALARDLPLQAWREALGDEAVDGIITQMNHFSLGAAKNQLAGHTGDDLGEEAVNELTAVIDAALAGGPVAPAVTALAAAGIQVVSPTPDAIKAELLATGKPQEIAAKLVEAGHIEPVQTYQDRLVEAEQAKAAAPVPAPSTRIDQWARSGGPIWLLGVLLVGAGAIMARRQIAAENAGTGTGEGSSDKVDFARTLAAARERITALRTDLQSLPMDTDAPNARDELDKINLELLQPVVEQRGRFMARHGLAVFAEYFSPFAATERNLARAWSAITDGHSVVARDAIERALDSLSMADEAWKRAEAQLK